MQTKSNLFSITNLLAKGIFISPTSVMKMSTHREKNVKKDLRLPEFAGPADFILLSDVRKSSENTSTEWQPTSDCVP